MVHQHFMLVPVLSVAENILLGEEPMKRRIFLDRAGSRAPDPRARGAVRLGDRPRSQGGPAVGRLAAAGRDPQGPLPRRKVLILDEPTAVLTPQETREIFDVLRRLRDEGYAIVFISHKLYEVLEIADRITVIRRGKVVGTRLPAETNEDDLAELMVGREVQLDRRPRHEPPNRSGAPASRTSHVRDDRGHEVVHDVSFSIRAGEILGIAGVAGNGQDELVEALTGLRKPASGSVRLAGEHVTGAGPRQLHQAGIGFVPGDRQRFGLVLSFPLTDNLVLNDYYHAPYGQRGVRNEDAITRDAEDAIARYDVRTPSATVAASTLSGGNQQKVVVAREFEGDLKLLVLDQPTRGLDVGSIEFIHRQAIARRDSGVGDPPRLGRAGRGPRAVRPDRGHVPRRDRRGPRRADRGPREGGAADGDRRPGRRAPTEAAVDDRACGCLRWPRSAPSSSSRRSPSCWPSPSARVFMILSSPLVDGSFNFLLPVRPTWPCSAAPSAPSTPSSTP